MNELKCPHCGKTFQVDESDYAQIVNQVRDATLNKELEARQKAIEEKYKSHLEAEKAKQEAESQKKSHDAEKEILSLKQQLDAIKKEDANRLQVELSKKDAEIAKLQGEVKVKEQNAQLLVNEAIGKEKEKATKLQIDLANLENDLKSQKESNENEILRLKQEQNTLLKQKDEQIEFYKNLKAQTSVKLLGETLEQHCLNSFNAIRAQSYPRAYFEKDNEVVEGSKGDFVFKNYDEFKTEYISIEFEMKNESDVTATKHKNEDFFEKLDKDRKKKGCEYAVLVSMLEKDSELYNQGIVDVSYRYPKMYVIRPQFFLPLISLLDNANKRNAFALAELEAEKRRNIDITNFDKALDDFKVAFGKNYETATNQFAEAIAEIDKSIARLEKVKENLTKSSRNLRLANDKAQELTIKKLTKNSPSLKEKFDAIPAEEE